VMPVTTRPADNLDSIISFSFPAVLAIITVSLQASHPVVPVLIRTTKFDFGLADKLTGQIHHFFPGKKHGFAGTSGLPVVRDQEFRKFSLGTLAGKPAVGQNQFQPIDQLFDPTRLEAQMSGKNTREGPLG